MITEFNFMDDEELRVYVLEQINHPGVIEVCRRLSLCETALEDVAEMQSELKDCREEIEDSDARIDERDDLISALEFEVEDLEAKISRLEARIESLLEGVA